MSRTPHRADWFFDYVSPYAYLAAELLSREEWPMQIRPVPVLFAGLLKAGGQLGPAEIPAKRRFTYRHIRWLARHHDIALRFPAAHPFNPLVLLRATLVSGGDWPVVRRLFRFVWRDGNLPDGPELESLLDQINVPPEALDDPAIKARLKETTAMAQDGGVFGVPALRLGELVFWGVDALPMFRDALEHPDCHRDAEARRLDGLPQAATRRFS